MKFDKKTGLLLFIALVLFVFVGLIMVNKKVEGMTGGCSIDQHSELMKAFMEYGKNNKNQTTIKKIFDSAWNKSASNKQDKFIKKNDKGKYEFTRNAQKCIQYGGN